MAHTWGNFAMLNPPQPWHALSTTDALAHLAVDAHAGLSANEVSSRHERYGANALPETPRRPWWTILLRQFASPLIYILLVSAVIALAMGKAGDAGVILIVVFLNAVIGAAQELLTF